MRQACCSRHFRFIMIFAAGAALVGSASSAPGQVWTERQKLVPSDVDASSRAFGLAVAIDGDYIAVGAPTDVTPPESARSGAIYVFRRIGTSWFEQQKLKVPGLFDTAALGRAVAIEGDVIVAGAPHDWLDDADPGEAYVFRRNGLTWTQEAQLVASGSAQEDGFGYSVSISGGRIVVGAPIIAFFRDGPGSAYVFRHDGGNWIEEGALLAADGAAADAFGLAVSINGDEIVVGAPGDDDACPTDPGCDSGSAYLFGFNGSTWTQEDKLVAADATESSKFGASVWNGPGRIFVGAAWANTAYEFTDTGGSWAEEARFTPSGGGVLRFGNSIDVVGEQVLVGAPHSTSAAAFLFSHDGVAWNQTAKLLTSDGDSVNWLGRSVSLGSEVAVVGSTWSGAYVYEWGTAECNCNAIDDACECIVVDPPLPESGGAANNRYISLYNTCRTATALRITLADLPGAYAALNGTQMWVGAPFEVSENAGKVDPADAPGFPTFWAASLRCNPYYTDWSTFPVVHVYDETIVPHGVYDIHAIGEGCEETSEIIYSAPLTVTQSRWGDVVSDCATTPCGPPDGVINVTSDATAILNKFKNLAGAPIKARSDLDMSLSDQKINISDVTYCLEAFGGFSYPFTPGPPPPPCP